MPIEKKRKDPRMERYFDGIQSLACAYRNLRGLAPESSLLSLIELNGMVKIGGRLIPAFRFLPGFSERYPLKGNEYDYEAKINQHRSYEKDLSKEISEIRAWNSIWRI